MDQFEARLACLAHAEKKFLSPGGGLHPGTEPDKIVKDAEIYAAFVLGKQIESKSQSERQLKGADEK